MLVLLDGTLEHVERTARLINDYGIAIIITSVYIVFTILLVVWLFRIISGDIRRNRDDFALMGKKLDDIGDNMSLIASTYKDKNKSLIRTVISDTMRRCTYEGVFTVNRFRKENNISNKQQLRDKTETYVRSSREQLENVLRQVKYGGRTINEYVDMSKYDAKLLHFFMAEVCKPEDSDRTERNLGTIYNNIKNEIFNEIHAVAA